MTTNEPRVSREHILAIAKKCGMVWGYTTTELVDAVIGFAYVLLNDKAVQESFVLANPRPVLDTLTQEISAMKQHCVEARQALDINDFAHCAYEIDAALKVGAGDTAVTREMTNAAIDVMLKKGDVILSADFVARIYSAMESAK